MTKFNVIQKKRRASVAERKRQLHGHPLTGKLKHKPQTTTISGKRKRKLLKKWRRDQKEAIEKGIITMEDVEMAIAEGASQDISKKSPTKFHVKKTAKFKVKQLKGKGKNKKNSSKPSKPASVEAPTQVDVMVE